MERTKLTIRVPKALLDEAKRYAREHRTTLTRLVSEYLRQLGTQGSALTDAPLVRRLSGSLPQDAAIEDHRAYLEEKHGQSDSRSR